MKFKKNLGQNFLINKNILNIIKKYTLRNIIIEIGTGLGFFCNTKKKHSIYIEYFNIYFKYLLKNKNFIIKLNILFFNIYLVKINLFKYFIIGNLPYRISFIILFYLINFVKISIKFLFTLQDFIFIKKCNLINIFYFIKNKVIIKNYNFFPKPKINSNFYKIIILSLSLIQLKDLLFFINLLKFIKESKTFKSLNLNYYIKLYFFLKKNKIFFYKVL